MNRNIQAFCIKESCKYKQAKLFLLATTKIVSCTCSQQNDLVIVQSSKIEITEQRLRSCWRGMLVLKDFLVTYWWIYLIFSIYRVFVFLPLYKHTWATLISVGKAGWPYTSRFSLFNPMDWNSPLYYLDVLWLGQSFHFAPAKLH